MADKKPFRWTDTRREVAALVDQGKTFTEIVALGYSLYMTSIVMNAMKHGERPPEEASEENPDGQGDTKTPKDEEGKDKKEQKEEGKDGNGSGKPRQLVAGGYPKASPIIFRFAQKEIILDPMELHTQYRYYESLANRDGGIKETFSEVLTLAMQTLWTLHQDVPMTDNMLRAIFSK